MLILTRRLNETLVIGNDVTVTVLDIKGERIRLGINAPPTVAVHRQELLEKQRALAGTRVTARPDGSLAHASHRPTLAPQRSAASVRNAASSVAAPKALTRPSEGTILPPMTGAPPAKRP